jgi:predicted outer membrane repeat protein
LLLLLLLAAAVVIQQSSFDSNSADFGGAIAIYQGPSLEIKDCEFTRNTAVNPHTGNTGNGGVVSAFADSIDGARMDISNSHFTDNTASKGGAIYIQNATTLNMSGVQLVGNFADMGGGALAVADDALGGYRPVAQKLPASLKPFHGTSNNADYPPVNSMLHFELALFQY